MRRSSQRLLLLAGALPLLVVGLALLYRLGMAELEGSGRGFWDSIEWAGSTLTTTGYGRDSHWRHPAMVVYVIAVQFLGLFLVYLIFPIYLIPFLEERFEVRLPRETPRGLAHHVVIFRYGPAVATLVEELTAARVPTLLLEADEEMARRLHDRGLAVLHHGQADGALAAANLARARALVVNGTDDENAAAILAARQMGFRAPVLALVEEPFHRRPMMLAGATAAFTPRHILGAALAAHASVRISPRLAETQQLGRHLEVAEVRVERQSPLAGVDLEAAGIAAQTGARVIGQWRGGELDLPSLAGGAAWRIEPGGILVAVGSRDSIERLSDLAGVGGRRRRREGAFVVAGFGEVGGKVVELLRVAGEEVRVIDRARRAAAGVDVPGDVLDQQVLEAAGVQGAQAVVLALDSDSATLFATVILKDLAPEVPVIARVNEALNVERIHRAGADFALSISQVSGQLLAGKLLGQEAFAVDPQLKVLKVPGRPLAGRRLADLQLGRRTGCSVAAVERRDDVVVDLSPDFRILAEDTVYICGSATAVRRFSELFRVG